MAKSQNPSVTPLMKQYYAIKAQHGDAILLFRVGDFYETFGEDAVRASSILGITLTRRAGVELAGFPFHAMDTYLPKLVRAGERVAVCDQLEDPKSVKGIVKRGVTELVTPGITYNDNILENRENTYLAAVCLGERDSAGVAFLDISTGEFKVGEGSVDYIEKLVTNFDPKEVVYQRNREGEFRAIFAERYYSYRLDEWVFSHSSNKDKLQKQFDVQSLKGFGIEAMTLGVSAAGAILQYLDYTEHKLTAHITSISRIDQDQFVWIDRFTLRNLELLSGAGGGKEGSLFMVLDRCACAMGSRLLRRRITMPLKDKAEIDARADVVAALILQSNDRVEVAEDMAQVGDIERIISRVSVGRVLPRELVQLKSSLRAAQRIKATLEASDSQVLRDLALKINPCEEVCRKIEETIYPDPSNQLPKGGVIADGVNIELDDLRNIAHHGKQVLATIQARESEATGIGSLKIGFNNVFGYYIEVTNTHKDKVPEGWIRKQTLTNAERYITEELKEYEQKILGAQERILALEYSIYISLLDDIARAVVPVQKTAAILANVDCLNAFATVSLERGYCRAEIDESLELDITQGRHPVIETLLPVGETYIPNDLRLDDKDQQIIIITGPNMAGKSALIRQTALIVLMAQIGCFVPATAARIGIVDKIFTRVGASDNISQGESTFMVEMLESATILNNITPRSLVLLDEIGRGTSTYDGISIAWSMIEYIHSSRGGAKTLFATHYHELNQMESLFERVKNYNVSVREIDNKIIFMRKLVRGGTEHSFGIHVAQLAGMPKQVVSRAFEVLKQLEATHRGTGVEDAEEVETQATPAQKIRARRAATKKIEAQDAMANMQLSIFQLDDPTLSSIRDSIKKIDVNNLTPLEALNKLNEIKKLSGL